MIANELIKGASVPGNFAPLNPPPPTPAIFPRKCGLKTHIFRGRIFPVTPVVTPGTGCSKAGYYLLWV